MKVAVIGCTNLGIAITQNIINRGQQVTLVPGEMELQRSQEIALQLGDQLTIGNLEQVKVSCDLFILACTWDEVKFNCQKLNDAPGKIIIDATMPTIGGLELDRTDGLSGGEQVAQWAPNLRVFKSLNYVGTENLRDPLYPEGIPAMFVAGNDSEEKSTVLDFVSKMGFDALDAGPLSNAQFLEQMGLFWIHLAHLLDKGCNFAFALIKR
jgi:predicted dinucleotide-binding enzyme